jgi:transposase
VSEISLPADPEQLRALVVELYAVVQAKDAQIRQLQGQVARLTARVEELEHQRRKDSTTSSKPPSSDSIFTKQPKRTDRSLRPRGQRRVGKQPGAPGATMRLLDAPQVRIPCPPTVCAGCSADLTVVGVGAAQRRQVTEPGPPSAPVTIEYVVGAKVCPACGTTSVGQAPVGVTGRAQYGPEAHAQAANLVCANYLPVGRARRLLGQLTGLAVSDGWVAGVRGKAAGGLEGFVDHVRELLRRVPALNVDETPTRAAGGLVYVHVACTRYLTLLHTGDRSAASIDAGGVLPGYSGIIVRDGYGGYSHLTEALHAWCGAHLLRDLRDVYEFEPIRQRWAHAIATLLLEARDAAVAARAQDPEAACLPPAVLADLLGRYRGLVAQGLATNQHRRTRTAQDAVRLARRFRDFEDMILRFVTHPGVVDFTNNTAEAAIRPVKVQMRSSGGCWRTLEGLAEFVVVHSYLSTAAKWGITSLDALRRLFTTGPWLPPAPAPPQATRARQDHITVAS